MNIHAEGDMSSGTEHTKRLLIFRAGGLLALHLEDGEPVTITSLSPVETPAFSLEQHFGDEIQRNSRAWGEASQAAWRLAIAVASPAPLAGLLVKADGRAVS